MITNLYFNNLNKVLSSMDLKSIEKAIKIIKETVANSKKVITCGNGGSAYAASHYITDWNKSFNLSKGKQFKGLSLCDNYGLVTAYANDTSYEEVFSGQLNNIGEKDDLLIVVSGSGNSKNIINALNKAGLLGIRTLAFVGYDGGDCLNIAEHSIHIPSFDMQICEDIHLILGHIIMKEICSYDLK